jgi:hypothetical protein
MHPLRPSLQIDVEIDAEKDYKLRSRCGTSRFPSGGLFFVQQDKLRGSQPPGVIL